MRTARLMGTTILLVAVLMAGVACAQKQPTQQQAPPKEVVVVLDANPTKLDPHDTSDNPSYSIERSIYEGLLGFDENMQIVGKLATSWEASPDARTFTFKLRDGVTFHDGTKFDAEAVRVNIQRLANPANKLARHRLFSMVDRVEVVDPLTVRVILKEPFGAMLNNFAHPAAAMISPKALEQYGKEIAQHPVGTGPFKFVEWVPGDRVVLEKYTGYWDKGQPAVDRLVFRPVPESSTRIAMLKAGQAHFVFPVPAAQARELEGSSDYKLVSSPSIVVNYVAMNVLMKPFDDKRVRQALNYAIDKEALIKVVAEGYGKPCDAPIAPNTWGYERVGAYPYDVQKARDLLKEAGYPNGFEATLSFAAETETQKLAVAIQQQLAQVGVKLNLQPMEWGALLDAAFAAGPKENKTQMLLIGWSPSTGDADWGLRPLFSKTMWIPDGYNFFYYNAQVEDALKRGLATADPAQRKAAYAEAQKLIMEDAPWIFLYVPDNLAGIRTNLTGVFVTPDSVVDASHPQLK
jgi:glutathione transport system substrate-binding protein